MSYIVSAPEQNYLQRTLMMQRDMKLENYTCMYDQMRHATLITFTLILYTAELQAWLVSKFC